MIFVLIMTVVVALLLTGFREVTKEQATLNEEIFNKRAILSAVEDYLGEGVTVESLSDEQVQQIFQDQMNTLVVAPDGERLDGIQAEDIDMAQEKKKPVDDRKLPVYIYEREGEQYYIFSVRGNGLWDEIWGNIALRSDLNTIAGASFDHKGETPGLGAEIKDNPSFSAQFKGTKIYNGDQFVSIKVRKGGAVDENHEVDGITGATVTADGVSKMMYSGMKLYQPYIESIREGTSTTVQGMLIND